VASSCDPDPALQLVCDTTGGGTSGTCRAPGKLGADCTQFACAKELYCNRVGASSTCAALPTIGQPCSQAGYRCATPYFCNTSQPPYVCDQPAQLGESCQARSCDTGLYCSTTGTRVCKARQPDGSVCTSFEQCLSDHCAFPPMGGATQYCQPSVSGLMCTGR
jgi:hypothetical protein